MDKKLKYVHDRMDKHSPGTMMLQMIGDVAKQGSKKIVVDVYLCSCGHKAFVSFTHYTDEGTTEHCLFPSLQMVSPLWLDEIKFALRNDKLAAAYRAMYPSRHSIEQQYLKIVTDSGRIIKGRK